MNNCENIFDHLTEEKIFRDSKCRIPFAKQDAIVKESQGR